MIVESVIWGLALAATAGLRLFMPFLFLGVIERYTALSVPQMLEWTGSDAGFLLLLIATFVEILADKIPIVDHVLDTGATFIKPVAGLILPVALVHDFSPAAAWTLGIVAGAPLALGVHTTKAGTRVASTAATVGTANPLVSIVEDFLAVAILVLALVAPLIALLLVIGLAVVVIRAARRLYRRLTV